MRKIHGIALIALFSVLMFDSLVLPLLPQATLRFFERAFGLVGITQIVAFNDLFAIFVGLYFVGLVEAVRAFVIPREEGFLSIVLSKPISRARYVSLNLIPLFAALATMGALLSLALPLKLAWFNGLDAVSVISMVAMGFSAVLLALALSAVATFLCLIVRDTYTATLLGFLLFSAVVVPAGGYMYRPDLFAGRPLAAKLMVFPANVLWLHVSLPETLPFLVAAAVAIVAGMFIACVAWMRATDIA